MSTDPKLVTSLVLFVAFLSVASWVLIDADCLRDDSPAKPKPYSFARVQLWWWTVLIVGSWILVYGLTKALWKLDDDCLALLGLGGATTAAGRIIDKRDLDRTNQGLVRHQNAKSNGFLVDILSDEHGLSVHRFQALAFHVTYGVAFVIEVFTHLGGTAFPDTFDASTLALLGVSAGTYVAMKALENKEPVPARATAGIGGGGRSDEIAGVDATGDDDDS